MSDIALHQHDQVVQVYYEVCVRYARHLSDDSIIQRITESMLGKSGVGSVNSQLRQRSAYLFLKFVDGLEGRARILLPYVSGFSSFLISDVARQSHQLTEQSELYMLEAAGILTSHRAMPSGGSEVSVSYREQQERILTEIAMHLQGQINSIRSHPNRAQFEPDLAVFLAHKVSSIAAIAKGHSYNVQTTAIAALTAAAREVSGAINEFAAYPAVRARGIIFMHRMITAIGPAVLGPIQECLAVLLRYSDYKDTDSTVQLLNQCLIEFSDQMLDLIDAAFVTIFEKIKQLYTTLEENLQVAPSSDEDNESGGVPRFDGERLSISKQFLVFIQHIVLNQCHAALSISRFQNNAYLLQILQIVISGLRGEISSHLTQNPSVLTHESSIPLRKSAILTLSGLVREWAPKAVGAGPISSQRGSVSDELSQAFVEVLYSEVLPYCLILCNNKKELVNGVRPLDLQDAQSLSLVSEIGGLLWFVAEVRGSQEISTWLANIYLSVRWPLEVAAEVSRHLEVHLPLGTLKDAFRTLMIKYSKS